jgi:hypothetical protein
MGIYDFGFTTFEAPGNFTTALESHVANLELARSQTQIS